MDVLIKGLSLPKKGEVVKLYICSDGDVGYNDDGKPNKTTAIELPPHGRLIDADRLIDKTKNWSLVRGDEYFDLRVRNKVVKVLLDSAPTILEAST